jgi:hypothetical protein
VNAATKRTQKDVRSAASREEEGERREESMTDSLSPQDSPAKDPADWVTGDEPMTGPQKSYLRTLAREAGRELELEGMSKADASRMIDELQAVSGRGTSKGR